jgi:thiol-disulfide isomerase/thioredoxin
MVKVRYPQAATVVTAAVAVFALILSVAGGAADEPQPPAESADAPAESAEEEKPDPFAVPAEATSEELTLFLRRIARMEPAEPGPEGARAHLEKMNQALDEVLDREIEDDTARLAANFKLQVLQFLESLGVEGADKQFEDFVAKLAQDKRPVLAEMGHRIQMNLRISRIPEMTPEERQELLDEVKSKIHDKEPDGSDVGLAMNLAGTFEQVEPALAIATYDLFAGHLEKSNDSELSDLAGTFRKAIHRIELLGHPVELTGETLAGEPFTLEPYKGKVVLIDFWATWCGPCIAELPNVKEHYAKYHDKGFEVVGISLDDDPDALQQFLQENEIPWLTLFSPDENLRGWDNPIADEFGVFAIPTVLMLDQEGKLISLHAHGPELGRLLQELLGDPLEVPEEKPETPAGESADKETANKP